MAHLMLDGSAMFYQLGLTLSPERMAAALNIFYDDFPITHQTDENLEDTDLDG